MTSTAGWPPGVSPPYTSVHDDAVRVLSSWVAPSEQQEALRREFLDQLAAHDDATRRDGPASHLTASCLVIDEAGGAVLLTRHRKIGRWLQFGGHIEDDDATLHEAAARELLEESGLPGVAPAHQPVHLDRHALPGGFGPCAEHLDVRYVAVAAVGASPHISEESDDVAWWPVDALPAGADSDLGDLIERALEYVRRRSGG